MLTGFEVGDDIVSSHSGKSGAVAGVRESGVPMVQVEWHDGITEWLPPELIRRDGRVGYNTARHVFDQNDGEVTKKYYAEMNAKGAAGQLAVALFRAQKRSTAAKNYRGRKFSQSAYDVKNWSMGEICRIAPTVGFKWGWKRDPNTPGYEWVLYVDLPHGQCSFHCASRLSGPDYPREWDGKRMSKERILAFCNSI